MAQKTLDSYHVLNQTVLESGFAQSIDCNHVTLNTLSEYKSCLRCYLIILLNEFLLSSKTYKRSLLMRQIYLSTGDNKAASKFRKTYKSLIKNEHKESDFSKFYVF